MSGQYSVGRRLLAAPQAHAPPCSSSDDGRQVRFVDPRRFGLRRLARSRCRDDWIPSLSASRHGAPRSPGLDEALPPMLHTRRAPLKSLLLDQRLVAGVGNIYAVEALWRAGIHPRRAGNRTSLDPAQQVSPVQCRKFWPRPSPWEAPRCVISPIPSGEMGYFAIQLAVYGRQGEDVRRNAERPSAPRLSGVAPPRGVRSASGNPVPKPQILNHQDTKSTKDPRGVLIMICCLIGKPTAAYFVEFVCVN